MVRTTVFHCVFIDVLILVQCSHLTKKQLPHILSATNGAPVDIRDLKTQNVPLTENNYFLETMSHFVREKIPERVVHSKGAGAFGYFEVTHNVSHICKAKVFHYNAKNVPVAVRFSEAFTEKGAPDLMRGPRGFSIRFFSDDGNFDIVGLNMPVFMIKDPMLYWSVAHSYKKNPASNLRDRNMTWDFISLHPETMHFLLLTFKNEGKSEGYRKMYGHGIHTYQVYNNAGETHFMRFHFIPEKHENIHHAKASPMSDPDFSSRDLHDAIERGDFPSWSLKAQILTMQDVNESQFDVFDVTRSLPEEIYPLYTLGKITLYRNPKNYFSDVEQMAFNPANLVPGILGAPDKVFEARKLVYRDALNYRLGVNYNNIRVNCPVKSPYTYARDGVPPVLFNENNLPNYFPNSYDGPLPIKDSNRPALMDLKLLPAYNMDQCSNLIRGLTDEERLRLVGNIVIDLREVASSIQQRVVNQLNAIDEDLGRRIAELLPYI